MFQSPRRRRRCRTGRGGVEENAAAARRADPGGSVSLTDRFPLRLARIIPGIAALVLTLATPASSSSTAPQPGFSGVPSGGGFDAEPTCTSCHTGFPINSDGRGVLTLSGVPKRYIPGERYTLVLELRHPDDE